VDLALHLKISFPFVEGLEVFRNGLQDQFRFEKYPLAVVP
jgi:hypothetical protein